MAVCSIIGIGRGSEREPDQANENVKGNESNEGLSWGAVRESVVALTDFSY